METILAHTRAMTESGDRRVDLVYDPDVDPYGATLVLHDGADEFEWTFDRLLLADGLLDTVGDGDVAVGPVDVMTVEIFLYTSEGPLRLLLPEPTVGSFVRAMLLMVPRGAEMLNLDLAATKMWSRLYAQHGEALVVNWAHFNDDGTPHDPVALIFEVLVTNPWALPPIYEPDLGGPPLNHTD